MGKTSGVPHTEATIVGCYKNALDVAGYGAAEKLKQAYRDSLPNDDPFWETLVPFAISTALGGPGGAAAFMANKTIQNRIANSNGQLTEDKVYAMVREIQEDARAKVGSVDEFANRYGFDKVGDTGNPKFDYKINKEGVEQLEKDIGKDIYFGPNRYVQSKSEGGGSIWVENASTFQPTPHDVGLSGNPNDGGGHVDTSNGVGVSTNSGGGSGATTTNNGGSMPYTDLTKIIRDPKTVDVTGMQDIINNTTNFDNYIKSVPTVQGPQFSFAPGVLAPGQQAVVNQTQQPGPYQDLANVYGPASQSGEDPNGSGSINTARTDLSGGTGVSQQTQGLPGDAGNQTPISQGSTHFSGYDGTQLKPMILYGPNGEQYDEVIGKYRDVVNGKTSYAMDALRAGMKQSRQNLNSLAASSVGMNPALKAKSFLGSQRQMEGDLSNQAAAFRSKEAIDAMAGMGTNVHNKTSAGLTAQKGLDDLVIAQGNISSGERGQNLTYLVGSDKNKISGESVIIDSAGKDADRIVDVDKAKGRLVIDEKNSNISKQNADTSRLNVENMSSTQKWDVAAKGIATLGPVVMKGLEKIWDRLSPETQNKIATMSDNGTLTEEDINTMLELEGYSPEQTEIIITGGDPNDPNSGNLVGPPPPSTDPNNPENPNMVGPPAPPSS